MINLFLEGPRGVGKSTIAKYIREHTLNSTQINHTGFKEDGTEGLYKISAYYDSWTEYFRKLHGDLLFIHDRYFFSEMIYSKLYKHYDFTGRYLNYLYHIPQVYDTAILIVFTISDSEELSRNLGRDKVKLFGGVDENKIESLIQQVEYLRLLKDLESMTIPNLKTKIIDVTGRTIEDISNEVLAFIN